MKTPFLFVIILLILASCKPSTPKEEVTEPPLPTGKLSDSLHGLVDTTVLKEFEANKPAPKPETSKPRITSHKCSPNFTLLSSPKKNQHVIYVTDFDHQEFECWQLMEVHSTKVCNEQNCTIIYVDKADVSINAAQPDLIDISVLKEHGIGRFTLKGKYWEIRGSSIWRRTGNGWAYYNTNNQFGG